MAICRTVLTVLLLLPVLATAEQRRPMCLSCHKAHYLGQGTCTTCHRGNDRAKRPEIAHHEIVPARFAFFALKESEALKHGKTLADRLGCRRCHRFFNSGNNVAVSLDRVSLFRSSNEIHRALVAPVAFMPDFRLDYTDAAALVGTVLAAGQAEKREAREIPRIVRFNDEGPTASIFAKKCGGCHRVLSRRHGPLGRGTVGPNLSGLFTPHYPRTFSGSESWSVRNLKAWLNNPRVKRREALMLPISLTKSEFAALAAELGAPGH